LAEHDSESFLKNVTICGRSSDLIVQKATCLLSYAQATSAPDENCLEQCLTL
jgi:hypothetical protein